MIGKVLKAASITLSAGVVGALLGAAIAYALYRLFDVIGLFD